MRTSSRGLVGLIALGVFVPAASFADSVVVLRVGIENPPATPSFRVPAPGTYTFSLGQNRTRVTYPDGTGLILDFDKKMVSSLDPTRKSFYQLKISDFLSLGEKVPAPLSSRFSEKTTVTFEPTVGQESRTIIGHSAAPYNLDLEALLSRQSSQGSRGGGFGRRHGGGGGGFPGGGSSSGGGQGNGFPGDPSTGSGNYLSSAGCKVGGEFWMANISLGDAEREQLAIAESCALMWGAPGLKGLTDRIRKTNLTPIGAEFSVSILDHDGQQPAKAPVVSVATASIDSGHFDSSLFTIPSDYVKIAPPGYPLGTDN